MGKLFGTDGIRGRAGHHPMTPEFVDKIGRAVARWFGRGDTLPTIVVGRDTRLSGPLLEQALADGLCAAGARVVRAGIIPTPAVALLCRNLGASAGIVVSASHNPYEDNGIKIFNAAGRKLSVAEEDALEALILDDAACTGGQPAGRVEDLADAGDRYQGFLVETVSNISVLKGMTVVLDCANGATSAVAPALFKGLGMHVTALFCRPDGTNINAGCGSEHPDHLRQQVVETKAHLGLALDGDGDRLVVVDETGQVLSGDQVLAICSNYLMKKGRLTPGKVVATVMSNIGLALALKQAGIELVLTDVGDRHVMEKMVATGAVVGGENSGHMIFAEHHSTGDGLLSALQVISAMAYENRPLSQLAHLVPMFPQTLINVAVRSKPELATVAPVSAIIREVEGRLGEKGRVLVRYSGTQSICRVMVEGPTEQITNDLCKRIAGVIASSIG